MNKGQIMEGLFTVGDLIDELEKRDRDLPVMIAVIKYPEEFEIRFTNGIPDWTHHTSVECHPLEGDGTVTNIDDIIYIAVELDDYSEERHLQGGPVDGTG